MTEMGDWHAYLMKRLADPEKARSYLDVALEEYQVDGDTSFFLVGLGNVVEAHGGASALADQTGIELEDLLETLSCETAPRLDIFIGILTTLGCRLSIAPLAPTDSNIEAADVKRPITPLDHSPPSIKTAPTEPR
ncbi:MAG: hypothetical protein OXI24_11655 [Candidatus Poribacteria bacterium]|nr:hypothetical protein [Candidatus Poribacteria bacterium]